MITHLSYIKKTLIISVILVRTLTLSAQQGDYNWRLGVSGGFTNYYGDLSPFRIDYLSDYNEAARLFSYNSNYVDRPSYRLTLERQITPTTGIMLSAGNYQFAGSDLYIDRGGNLNTGTPEFQRALNFNTTLTDVGLSLVFKTDNDKLFSKEAFFAPYFTIGAGWFNFDVSGDLRDDNGNFYDYSAGTPQLNGNFETDLSQIRTNEEQYLTEGWYAQLGLGLKFRLSRRLDLNIESFVNFTNNDFLDDVSGNYPASFDTPEQAFASLPAQTGSGNQRGTVNHNDLYIYHGVTLKYNFGYREKSFRAPTVHNYGIDEYEAGEGIYDISRPDTTVADTAKTEKAESPIHTTLNVFNYAAVVQQDDSKFQQQTNEHLFELRKLLEISGTQSQLRDEVQQQKQIESELDALRAKIDEIESDTNMEAGEKRKLLRELNREEKTKQERLNEKIGVVDSLNLLISDIRKREVVVDSNAGSATKIIIGADTQTYYLPGNMKPAQRSVQRDTVFFGEQDTLDRETAYVEKPAEKRVDSDTKADIEVNESVRELQKQIDELKQESEKSKQRKKEQTEKQLESRDEEIEELKTELAELRGIIKDRTSEETIILQQESERAREASRTDLRGVNANLAAQTAAITALSYALLRDDKTTDEEKQEIQKSLAALDSLIAQEDSLALPLETAAAEEIQASQPRVDTVRQVIPRPAEKVQVTDSALKALENRINMLSAKIEGDKPETQKKESDTLPQNIEALIQQIDALNQQLEAQKERAKEAKTPGTKQKATDVIYFDLNSSSLTVNQERQIEKLVTQWRETANTQFELTAYADNTGSVSYNIRMCENRLNAVKQSILSHFKPGEQKPRINLIIGGTVVRSSSSRPQSEDRRVDVILKSKK